MKLVPVSIPNNVRPAEGEEPVVRSDGTRFEGFYGPNDERYERCTGPSGSISWLRLFYDGDEASHGRETD
jgi:hypothetical protein